MKFFLVIVVAFGLFCACSSDRHDEGAVTALADTSQPDTLLAPRDNTATTATMGAEQKIDILKVQVGMKDEKVKMLLGKPTKVDVLNAEVGARVEDWYYGNNQMVRITGGQVTRVIEDIAKEQETLQKINEARASGDEAEAERLLKEIAPNQ